MFGFKKRKKLTLKELTTSASLALDDLVMSGDSDELLSQSGMTRQQLLDKVKTDDKVESCIEDLRGQLEKSNWRIWGEDANEDHINLLYKLFTKHFDAFIELALTAKLNGFAVAEYLFEQTDTGFVTISNVLDKDGELDNYTLKRGGRLFFNSDSGEIQVDTELKHLVLTSQATLAKPTGRPLLANAYPAVMLRQKNFPYAGQFLKRYAQPYIVGKQGSMVDSEAFVDKLHQFIFGGAAGIGKDDDITMMQNSANGEFFKTLEKLCNARIEDLLLGKIKTANLDHSSRAAQETEEASREGRVASLAKLVSKGIQHALESLVEVNKLYGIPIHAPDGLWFEFLEQASVDVNRAERDKKYLDTGQVRLTKDYYVNIVGYEEDHVELLDLASSTSTPTATTLSHANMSHASMPHENISQANCQCRDCQNEIDVDKRQLADDDPEHVLSESELDEGELDADQKQLAPKINTLLSALSNSKDYEEFSASLDTFDLTNQSLIDDMTLQNAKAIADGITEKS